MFRALASYNYRLWFGAGLVGNIGSWVQTITVNWFVLTELTDHDALAVGITLALQFAPALLLVPVTGWVADRFERRQVALILQSLLTLQALAVAILVLTGAMSLPLMWVLSLAFGVLGAFDLPTRQAFVSDLVPAADIPNAVALNSGSMSIGRLIGPAVAGVILAVAGPGWAFLANSASFVVVVTALLCMRRGEILHRASRTGPPDLLGGVRYVAGRPDLAFVIAALGLVGIFAMNVHFTSSVMVEVFHGDAAAFGALNSIMAAGSVVGALIAARSTRANPFLMVAGMAVMAIAAGAAALAPAMGFYAVSLLFTGLGMVVALSIAGAYVQSTTPPLLRGRVLAVHTAVVMGSLTVGSPLLGLITVNWGARWAVGVGALAAAIVSFGGYCWLRRARRTGQIHTPLTDSSSGLVANDPLDAPAVESIPAQPVAAHHPPASSVTIEKAAPMTVPRFILSTDHGCVRVLTLHRPESLNAISRDLGYQLIAEFERADADPAVRAIVLTGSGSRAFSAGGDLKERVSAEETLEERNRFAWNLLERPRSTPSIAAVNGLAFGGGLELVLSCDFAIGAPHVRFALPEVTRGIIASGGGVVRLPAAIGRSRALQMGMTGLPIDAATALEWGLLTEIVSEDALLARAIELGNAIARNAPLAVDASRRIMVAAAAGEDAWSLNRELRQQVGASEDAKEGPRAFAERRAARWSGN